MSVWKDDDGWNLEVRVWRRWFLEGEFRAWIPRLRVEFWNVPTASDLVGGQMAAEVEEFLDEERELDD